MQIGGTGGEARQQANGLVTLDQKQMKQMTGGRECHRLGCLQRHDAVPLRHNTFPDVRDDSSRFLPARRLELAPVWLRSPAPSSECSARDEGGRAAGTSRLQAVAAPSNLSRSPRVKQLPQSHVQVGRHVLGVVELLVDCVQRIQKRCRLGRRLDSKHGYDRRIVLQCRLQLGAKQLRRDSEALLEVEEETEKPERVCRHIHQTERLLFIQLQNRQRVREELLEVRQRRQETREGLAFQEKRAELAEEGSLRVRRVLMTHVAVTAEKTEEANDLRSQNRMETEEGGRVQERDERSENAGNGAGNPCRAERLGKSQQTGNDRGELDGTVGDQQIQENTTGLHAFFLVRDIGRHFSVGEKRERAILLLSEESRSE